MPTEAGAAPRRRSLLIFAGGRGSRLGGLRKATLVVGGRTILERVLDSLAPLADEHLALVPDDNWPQRKGLRFVLDPSPYAGPLAALAHGLRAATGDVCLLVASDMPFVSREAFTYLLELQAKTGASVVVPFVDGFVESMHAVVQRLALIEAITSAQPRGEQRLFKVLESLEPRLVHPAELRAVDPDLHTLFNVNTPEDLAEAERMA
jgi:molybdopterin-guanine dinucleotide biosynthesis protein A